MIGTQDEFLPVRCQLCGEIYPDEDALWDHECPEWQRIRQQQIPTLAAHRNIIEWFDRTPGSSWTKRLMAWGMARALPDKEDPDLLDLLLRLGPRWAFRFERKLVRKGLVDDNPRSDTEKIRRQYEIENEMERSGEGERRARNRVDRRRARNRPRKPAA